LSEFDEFSDNYWARNKSLDEALQRIRDDFAQNRDHIKMADDFTGIPVPNDYLVSGRKRLIFDVRRDADGGGGPLSG
jgi:Cu/Ag efflux pump CusA